jgi:hypothetical protein
LSFSPFTNLAHATLRFLLIAVFVVPSLVPAGYMLSRNAETNLVEITICSGTNHRVAYLDVNSGDYFDVAPDTGETTEVSLVELCPFAVGGLDDQIDVSTLPIATLPTSQLFSQFQTVSARVQAITPVSRGPPVLPS